MIGNFAQFALASDLLLHAMGMPESKRDGCADAHDHIANTQERGDNHHCHFDAGLQRWKGRLAEWGGSGVADALVDRPVDDGVAVFRVDDRFSGLLHRGNAECGALCAEHQATYTADDGDRQADEHEINARRPARAKQEAIDPMGERRAGLGATAVRMCVWGRSGFVADIAKQAVGRYGENPGKLKKIARLGHGSPHAHLKMARRKTPTRSASASCESPARRRQARIFSLRFTRVPPVFFPQNGTCAAFLLPGGGGISAIAGCGGRNSPEINDIPATLRKATCRWRLFVGP